MTLPADLLKRFQEYQRDEAEWKARKNAFLSSLAHQDEKMGDRVLMGLQAEERALKTRRDTLAKEVKERLGLDL